MMHADITARYEQISSTFEKKFGSPPEAISRSPGRAGMFWGACSGMPGTGRGPGYVFSAVGGMEVMCCTHTGQTYPDPDVPHAN